MYREDDVASAARADALIAEIAELERQKVAHVAAERRLDEARRELQTLQVTVAPVEPRPATGPGLGVHLMVFGVAACATYLGYTLAFA